MTAGTDHGDPAPVTRVSAPAKVNFGLRIAGRRADGYHELQSLFLPLDLADDLALYLSPQSGSASDVALVVEGDALGVPTDATNLAARAARDFLRAAGLRHAVRVRLTKRIPCAAGLGGGSSDAGAVLRALAKLFPAAVSPRELARLAVGLGADVPFFLDPRPARVSGIGEQIEPVPGLPPFALLLAHPGVPLATAGVYEAFDALRSALTERGPDPTLAALSDLRGDSGEVPTGALARFLENDLEPAAVRLCPPVGRLRDRIRNAGALAVGMSGSGPTVFGVFADRASAREALERAGFERPVRTWLAATIGSR